MEERTFEMEEDEELVFEKKEDKTVKTKPQKFCFQT